MLQHHLLLIYRNFRRSKSSFLINLIGLSSGLACTLLIYLWVNDELSVDKFHENDSRLYQVMSNELSSEKWLTTPETPALLATALAEEMPEVEYAVTATPSGWFDKFTLSVEEHSIKAKGKFAGKDFFKIFSYLLIEGDKSSLLTDKNSIVISEELADKLFGTSKNVIGRTIIFQHDLPLEVSGIFKGIPHNATDQFDMVLSFNIILDEHSEFQKWSHSGPNTYISLQEGIDINQFNDKIAHFIKSKYKESTNILFVRLYSDQYLYDIYENGKQAGGRITYVKLFSLIAVFILIIACINFMNLSTAKASGRIKEVGIKKAVGAQREILILQYMGEATLIAFVSLLTAVLLVMFILPHFNAITGKQLALNFDARLIISMLGIMLITGLVAGSYPALYLSGFNPVAILKGGGGSSQSSTSIGELWARKGLVVFQFTISIILIVGVLVVYKQIEFVQTKNVGFDKEHVIVFNKEGKVWGNTGTFLSEMKNIPGIANASSISSRLIGSYGTLTGLSWEGHDPEERISFEIAYVDYDMLETLGIELLSGRSFSRKFSRGQKGVVLNEAAVSAMGFEEPVGKAIKIGDEEMHILGIAKNFHFESLHTEVKPFIFTYAPQHTDYIMAKIEAGREKEALSALQHFYSAFNPGFVLDFRFLDEKYQAQYESEKQVVSLSRYFAGLAVLISCLGLFGLAAFTAESRRKEIGVRKALGSSDLRILYLLSGDFTKLVLTAIIFALPTAYLVVRSWLNGFAYRIELDAWYFIVAGLTALVVAWLTVGMQAIKAANINPVKALKYE